MTIINADLSMDQVGKGSQVHH